MDLETRGQVYRLLSWAYHAPREDFLSLPGLLKGVFPEGPFTAELQEMESYLLGLADLQELAVEHTRLFRGPVRAEAYPYESMYLDGQVMGPSAMSVAEQYGRAGLQISQGFRDLPDHICAELEFMYYLCFQEGTALQKGDLGEADRFHLLACSFLNQHLARWVLPFTGKVLESARTPFYLGLARLTRQFIAQEARQPLTSPAGG